MRKLKLQVQMTLDGFVAGPNGEADWIRTPGKPDESMFQYIVDLADSSDTLLLGRKTAQGFLGYWENVADSQPDSREQPLAQRIVNMRKIVFSRTQAAVTGRNAEMESGDLATAVQALKKEPGQDILVYGGADFVTALIGQDLIDEYFLFVSPVALGSGLPIFKEKKSLLLESATAYTHGKALLKYLPVRL